MSESLWSMFSGGSFGKSYTLNFDGSHINQAKKSGAGCIIRDNQGEMIIAAAYNLTETYSDYCNVAIAEAVALRNGLKLAKDYNLKINLIKGDSKEVIDHVLNQSRRLARSPLSEIIQQIKGFINLFLQKIEVVDREANKVADKLASWGSNRLEVDCVIYTAFADLPPQVGDLIKEDRSCNNLKEANDGEGSSMASNIGMAGAAVAGVAMLAWGVSKLFGETSSDDQQHNNKNKAKAPWNYMVDATENYASKVPQMGPPKLVFRDSSYDQRDPWNNMVNTIQNDASKIPQMNDYYILNFDGSDINQHQRGGAGCIIKNKKGELVIAAAFNLDNLYPNHLHVAIAEAIALKNGLKLAKSKKIKLDLIKGDNKEVIDRVIGNERKPARFPFLNEVILKIREALYEQSIDSETQIKLIDREANRVADELATLGSKLGYGMEKIYTKEEDLTFKLAQLIKKDNILMGISK